MAVGYATAAEPVSGWPIVIGEAGVLNADPGSPFAAADVAAELFVTPWPSRECEATYGTPTDAPSNEAMMSGRDAILCRSGFSLT